jgi:hypothetical protein
MAEYDLVAQGNEPYNIHHMDHCYDYLRQVVMCGGDVALAGEDMPGGSSQFDVPHKFMIGWILIVLMINGSLGRNGPAGFHRIEAQILPFYIYPCRERFRARYPLSSSNTKQYSLLHDLL